MTPPFQPRREEEERTDNTITNDTTITTDEGAKQRRRGDAVGSDNEEEDKDEEEEEEVEVAEEEVDGDSAEANDDKVSPPFYVAPSPSAGSNPVSSLRRDSESATPTSFAERARTANRPHAATASPTPPPTLPWPILEEEEVRNALFSARPFAPDQVPNHVLQLLWPSLRIRLVPLLAASLALGHLPSSWRDADGVVLKNPKKDDYSMAKAYRLICFERCVSRLLESIVARRWAHLAEAVEGFLPPAEGGKVGRRKRRSRRLSTRSTDVGGAARCV
jgi:hypothetical protein